MSTMLKAGLTGIIAAFWVSGAAALQGGVITDTQMRVGPGDSYPVVASARTGEMARVMSCPNAEAWCLAKVAGAIGWLPKTAIGEIEKADNGMTSNGENGHVSRPVRIVYGDRTRDAGYYQDWDPFQDHHVRVWGTRHVGKAWNFGRVTREPTYYIGFDVNTRTYGPARIRVRSGAWNFGRWHYERVD